MILKPSESKPLASLANHVISKTKEKKKSMPISTSHAGCLDELDLKIKRTRRGNGLRGDDLFSQITSALTQDPIEGSSSLCYHLSFRKLLYDIIWQREYEAK